ncbi:Gfo/Idh/MocA family protein [Microbacterium sp. NPDC056736]|uniref:Gfo/Idh/MocA family protein n=1 Tax=Microbacterium sp. NPDC056736 TaxID=3345932 RepID=UPI003670DC28
MLLIDNPEMPPLRGGPPLRWGTVGAGLAAGWFVTGLHRHTDHRVQAVVSGRPERAREFAEREGIPRTHPTVEALLEDESVDIVYIATPNSTHAAIAEECLRAGRHVLVEKPFATTAEDARRILELARERGLLALDATWTRYQPKSAVVRAVIARGDIGTPLRVEAALGHVSDIGSTRRQFDPTLDGGVLFEMGIYSVDIAVRHLGLPSRISTTGVVGPSGVDVEASVEIEFATASASASASFVSAPSNRAIITGTEGTIEIADQFVLGNTVIVDGRHGQGVWIDQTLPGPDGLAWQAVHAADYIARDLVESPLHPHVETIATIGVLERARHELGVTTH